MREESNEMCSAKRMGRNPAQRADARYNIHHTEYGCRRQMANQTAVNRAQGLPRSMQIGKVIAAVDLLVRESNNIPNNAIRCPLVCLAAMHNCGYTWFRVMRAWGSFGSVSLRVRAASHLTSHKLWILASYKIISTLQLGDHGNRQCSRGHVT